MNKNKTQQLIIIGSGPAGLTAGIYAARANLQPLIIEGKEPGGQLMGTTAVENWPGNSSIQGPQLMMNMKEHAQHMGCEFIVGDATNIDFSKKPFTIWTDKEEFKTDSVIIATGATPKRLKVPGENDYWGKGVTTCAVCDGALYKNQPVVIVGGGDTAMETASFMTKFTNQITVVQILDKLTASHAMQQRVVNNPKIKIILNTTVTEIKGDGKHVNQVIITDQKTQQQKSLDTQAVFIAIGLKPNTSIFKDHIELDDWSYIKLHDTTKTSVEGVFAAGDVHDYRYRQAITAAGAGCMAALDVEKYLSSIKK